MKKALPDKNSPRPARRRDTGKSVQKRSTRAGVAYTVRYPLSARTENHYRRTTDAEFWPPLVPNAALGGA